MNNIILYIAGPMAGYRNFNRATFNTAQVALEMGGYKDVLNPARIEGADHWTYRDYMKEAIKLVIESEGVAMLPGSEWSRGATVERDIAWSLGIPVKPIEVWITDARYAINQEYLEAQRNKRLAGEKP